jgi:predicted ATPase/class 3 adenylate cyclase/DNA-binding CsgD family transcriptional regulator
VADRIGEQLGNYRLKHILGRGNFADVYLGLHIHLNIEAAIKVLHGQLADDDVSGFLTEARTIAHLRHPHITRVLDFGVEGTTPFLVMDYAPNGNLRQRYPKGTQVPLDTVVSYVKQIADALQYAHRQRLIHRDIKPENMLLGRNHEVLLSDFGIAILAQQSRSQHGQDTAGTIAYMAPEQMQAHACLASDQYALGVVVYEWISGDRPFRGSLPEIAIKHTLVSPPSLCEQVPIIPPAVERAVFKALAKHPKDRFEQVQDFAVALEEASIAVVDANRTRSPEGTVPVLALDQSAQAAKLTTHALPTGTITLLFTDIEGSTRLLQQAGSRYVSVLDDYRRLLRAALQQWSGFEVYTQGDSFFVVFARATDAVEAAVAVQRSLATYQWPEGSVVRVRMGLHTGEPEHSSQGYTGLDVQYAARLMKVAHGGQVLLSQTARTMVEHDLPEGVSLRDLGEHHLKDFHGPKRLFQLAIADLPANFPPLRTLDVRLNNLTVQLTSLIGREKEVMQVCTLLQRPDVRLVTLTGMGGIGKTRLSVQVAVELFDTFADGTYFVSLASVSEPQDVINTIVHLLGLEHHHVKQGSATEHMEYLKAFLRDKHLLLLLDNFEQVIAAAPHLTELLVGCPHLRILVTSRATLHIQGEHEFPVPPLALPKRALLSENEDLSQYAAVALFLERALAIKPDLAVTKANMQAIAAICVHLDGLPLAIELAAARSKLFPPRALLQRMTHRLDVLTGGPHGVPARQQTLRNMIAWSYNLLDAAEQRLFQRLSVFAGSYTLEAVESYYGAFIDEEAQILDGIESLIDNNLLLQIEQEGEEPRLLMLETIREFGLEALAASGEDEIARQAYIACYLALAEKAGPELVGPQQAAWLRRLEWERVNLHEAMRWSVEQGKIKRDMTVALRLGIALRNFWTVHGPYSEGRKFLEQTLAASEGVAASVQAKALFTAAHLAFLQSDHDRAEELCQESLKLFRELGDRPNIAYVLYLLSWISREDIQVDIAMVEEALELFKEIGDKEYVAWSYYTLGYSEGLRGEYDRACAFIEESLIRHKEIENKRGVAFSLIGLAQIYFYSQSNQATMNALLDESLALFSELDDKTGIAYSSSLRGQISLVQEDAAKARLLIEESQAIYRELGAQQGIAESLCQLARVMAADGDDTAAYSLYKESLAIAREIGLKELIASCLEGLAEASAVQGEIVWAAQLWGAAEVLREAVSVPVPFVDRANYNRAVTAVCSQLGEKDFAAAWTQGRAMTLQQVLTAQGREVVPAPGATVTTATPSPTYPAGLTAREVEVLRLVARGLTNNEIAGELRLSEKTVAHHLTHIFNKTTSENRAGAAAFAIRHGLA